MFKYALRYSPLLLLALVLIPWRIYAATHIEPDTGLANEIAAPFQPGSALHSVVVLSANDVWAAGGSFYAKCDAQTKTRCASIPAGGTILHYNNGTWAVTGNAALPLLGISLDTPSDGWAVGYGGTFVHYDGSTWSAVAGPNHFNQSLYGVVMLSPSNGWAVGNSGSILHYNGRQWMPVSSPVTFDLRAIAMPSAQEGWAVGVNGTILRYQNGTWSVVHSPTRNTLNGIVMLSPSEGWAVGEQNTILHYRAGDGTWEAVYRSSSIAQSANLYGVAMNAVRAGWIVGEQQLLTYSSEIWTSANMPVQTTTTNTQNSDKSISRLNLYGVAFSREGEGWAVGSTNENGSNTIVILHYSGGTWSVSLTMN